MSAEDRPKIALGLEYPLALRGGVSMLVEELIRALAQHYRIVLVSPDSSAAVSSQPICDHVAWNPRAVSRSSSRRLAARLVESGVVIAHFHFGGNYGWGSRIAGQSPIGFARRLGIRCVTTVHSFDSILDGYCGPQKPLWIKLALLPAAWLGKMSVLARIDAEIAVSRENYGRLRAWYWPMRARFRQVYHSRLESMLPVQPVVTRNQIILSVGHVAFRKGQHILAQAFAEIAKQYPEWRLVMIGPIGESACLEHIESTIVKHGLAQRVTLLGSRDDVSAFMQTASIYVQPSIWEGLGLALQEALFYGCACIGSRVGGIPELIEDGKTGLLVRGGDCNELSKALQRLISNETLRRELAARSPQSIAEKGMSAEQMVNDYLKLYESIVDGH